MGSEKYKRASFLRRWRHRRGFGVHSPFGFEVIKRVIKPESDKAYYAYEDFDFFIESSTSSHSANRKLIRRARMIHRLSVFLNCQETEIYNFSTDNGDTVTFNSSNLYKLALLKANSKTTIRCSVYEGKEDTGSNELSKKEDKSIKNKLVLVNLTNTSFEKFSENKIISKIKNLIDSDVCCVLFFDESSRHYVHRLRHVAESVFYSFPGGMMLNSHDCHLLFLHREMEKQRYCF